MFPRVDSLPTAGGFDLALQLADTANFNMRCIITGKLHLTLAKRKEGIEIQLYGYEDPEVMARLFGYLCAYFDARDKHFMPVHTSFKKLLKREFENAKQEVSK
jgi:hypothetical protein